MKKILFSGLICAMAFGFNKNDENFCAEFFIGQNGLYIMESENIKSEVCQSVMKTQIIEIFGKNIGNESQDGVSIFKIYGKKDNKNTMAWIKRGDYILDIEKGAQIKGQSVKDLKKRDIKQFEKIKGAFAKLEKELTISEFDKTTQEVIMASADRTDAHISRARGSLYTVMQDFESYYTGFGKFIDSLKMTHVKQPISIENEVCATYNLKSENEVEIITNKSGICEEVFDNFDDFKTRKIGDMATIVVK
ncbi:MAG: hypothetical protein J6M21_03375 [Campylobacter sp.]|nr:hypothetical protein [Campylobacter sp.]